MIAISLWQPWASAIAVGLKRFETRSWPAQCPGNRIAIHAAKRNTLELRAWWFKTVKTRLDFADAFAKHGINDWCDLPLGAVVATADLIAVHETEPLVESCRISEPECIWGDFAPGRYAWELDNIRPLKAPSPAIGRQGFFIWEEAA